MQAQVVELMGEELGWSRWRKRSELNRALAFLDTFDSPKSQQQQPAVGQQAGGSAAAPPAQLAELAPLPPPGEKQ